MDALIVYKVFDHSNNWYRLHGHAPYRWLYLTSGYAKRRLRKRLK